MTEGMRQRLAYNPERDLVPVAMVARSPNIFIVHPSVPVKSVAELIEFSRSRKTSVMARQGVGSNPHLIGELFAHRFKLNLTHVPYKGGGAGIATSCRGRSRC